MHGARGGAGPGKLNPAYRHGGRTKEAVAMRKMVAELARESREVALSLLGSGDVDQPGAEAS